MKHRWFVRGDIDGFFGLFIDNLLQLMVIAVLGRLVSGLPTELITGRILPGAAVSILIGNLLYAWQARRLMRESGRTDVTALPYGINTPSLLAFLFLIMGPVYQETGNPTLAWQAGLLACLLSGIMETAGAFVGDWMRRQTPRAALLSALAGVAITFIAMGFTFQIFAAPAIALLPMLMILISYASHARLPLGMPGGWPPSSSGPAWPGCCAWRVSRTLSPQASPIAWPSIPLSRPWEISLPYCKGRRDGDSFRSSCRWGCLT